jgi:diamine N-acetyltransferase
MAYLCNDELRLRQLEPGDLGFLYRWENDPLLWGVSEFVAPYSQNALKAYIENELKGIFVTGQLRLMIELKESDEVVGTIDLFDFDPMSKRAGVGIFVVPDFQRKGVASAALDLLVDYAFGHLNLRQLHCKIGVDNVASLKLFERAGFERAGVLKDWVWADGCFRSVAVYQLINIKEDKV